MKINHIKKINFKGENVLFLIVLILFLAFTLTPLIWCFIISITPEFDMFSAKGFLPDTIVFDNYREIFNINSPAHESLFNGLKNSLLTSIITIIIGIPICVLAAYTFSRYKFKGRNFILKFILTTIVIPLFTTIIPIYAIFSNYGMLDKLFWVSIIYVTAFLPMNTWIIMNYFNSIPHELWEAGRMDGCSEAQIFFKIILPISYPILITSCLIMFLMAWNQFQIPLILTSSQDTKVVTLVLSEFMGRDAISYGIIAVCGLISILPPALIAIFFRKFLISGLTSGSVKG